MARLYSVWNPTSLSWDYYQAPGELRAGVFAEDARLSGGFKIGMTVEEAARPLPVGATLVGRGAEARGMVATRNGGRPLGIFGLEGDTLFRVALFAGGAYLAWRYMETGRLW